MRHSVFFNVTRVTNQVKQLQIRHFNWGKGIKDKFPKTVEDTPPFGGRGIPFYLLQFVSILGNLYPGRGVKGPFLGMFEKMDLCKKISIQAYTSLILSL